MLHCILVAWLVESNIILRMKLIFHLCCTCVGSGVVDASIMHYYSCCHHVCVCYICVYLFLESLSFLLHTRQSFVDSFNKTIFHIPIFIFFTIIYNRAAVNMNKLNILLFNLKICLISALKTTNIAKRSVKTTREFTVKESVQCVECVPDVFS